jgi:bifunctional DNA-binding transcriptional regulator/antitoxin component of YhaV-PrlF toxin-antitoxin module
MAIAKARIGKKGEIVIPTSILKLLGVEKDAVVEIESTPEGLVIRPAQLPVKMKDVPADASDKPGEME